MTLRVRLVASFAYVLVLVMIAVVLPLALNLRHRAQAEAEAHAESQARIVAALVSGRLQSPEADRLVRRAANELGGRVIVVNRQGRLVVDSAGSARRGTAYLGRPEIARALNGRQVVQLRRHSDSLDADLIVTSVPVFLAGNVQGAVRVSQDLDAIRQTGLRDSLALVGFGGVALALGIAAAWLLAGSLARPLRRLAATARRIAGGDLASRAPVEGPREQRELAVAFNEMTRRLASVLEAQREFVANASHQLRTPLTGLRLRIEAAALKTGDPELRRELVAAEAETERLSRLLNGLLALAREGADPGPGTFVRLEDLIEEAVLRWSERARTTGHDLVVSGRGDVAVRASREDLAMALDNLIENALNYAPAGTAVRVEWSPDAAAARLVVADEGPGFAPEELERVFERFYRGAEGGRKPGTGLGLAIVGSIAERWGGEARIGDRERRGATVEIVLPSAREDPGEGLAGS